MKYPKTGSDYYAKFVNNGTFIVNSGSSFGGMLYTEKAGAKFDIIEGTTIVNSTYDSATSGSGTSAECTTASMTLSAQGVIGSESDYASGTFGNESYTSASVTKSDGNTDYYWNGTRYYETITVSVTVPGVTGLSAKYSFSISYTDKAGKETSSSITGNTGLFSASDKIGSYAVKKGSTFTVSATRSGKTVTLTATPNGGTAQSATASSSGGTVTLSSLSADQNWTITMSS